MTLPIYHEEKSDVYLSPLAERERLASQVFPDVKTILVVLSSRAVTNDWAALKQKIHFVYPQAEVYFRTTSGQPFKSPPAPSKVDLLIDFTGPGMRQGWFYALSLRGSAKYAVGRNAGLFRKGRYDRIFDEKDPKTPVSKDVLERERVAQKRVLELAGIPSISIADAVEDRGKEIALELPPLMKH